VKVAVAGETGAGCDLFWRRRRRAVRVAPPVMRIGVRLWLSIRNSFGENKTRLRAGVVRGDDPKTDGSNKSYGYVKSL